jgi:hypothetical protein
MLGGIMSESLRNATRRGVQLVRRAESRPIVCQFVRCLQAFFLLACPVLAQVTIKNPDHLEVPEQKVQILFHTTCEVVAQEFHLRERDVDFRLLLILGDPNERYTSDEEHQLYTIYLYRWNDAQFAASAMRLAIQHMVSQSRRDTLVKEILKRSNGIDTVSIKSLRSHR